MSRPFRPVARASALSASGLAASEERAFWAEFLRGLVNRGLQGAELVISDAHEGLKGAIAEVLAGASCKRCRMHLVGNILAHVPKAAKALVAAAIRTVFAQPDREAGGKGDARSLAQGGASAA